MLVLDRDGMLISNLHACQEPRRGYAVLDAAPSADLSAPIKRLLDLAFGYLGLRSLELRVRPADELGCDECGVIMELENLGGKAYDLV